MEVFKNILEDFERAGLYPRFIRVEGSSTLPQVKIGGESFLMFGSNNYLGLANNKEVIERAYQILKQHGVGPGGSRILSGNLVFLEKFEKRLAEYIGVEDTITFPTGYMANMGVIPAVMGPFINTSAKENFIDGVIFSDQYNHATIVDACRLTPAKKVIYKHNDLKDLALEIEKFPEIHHRMIITESVYSIEGTLTDVNKIVDIAKKSESILMIDDAHGLGVLGADGSGVIKEFNLRNAPDIYMASFDKAMGTTGGFIGGSKRFIDYLRIASRPYIFSSALPAVAAAASWAVIDIVEKNPSIIKQVNKNASNLRKWLQEAGFSIMGNGKTPAVPLYIGDDSLGIKFSEGLFEERIFAPCFRWPAAPAGRSRIRISVMASHSDNDLIRLVEVSKKVGKKIGLV